MKQDVTVELAGGKQIKFETGRMAKQASGAAFTTSGDNVVSGDRGGLARAQRKASTSSR